MKRLLLPSLALLLTIFLTVHANADFALTLSSPDNLSDLKVGQQVTFQVTLSGLGASDTLDELQTDVTFPSKSFSITAITPGPIVPDITGFSSGSGPTSGTGIYDDLLALSNTPISSNGLFFSVTATAAAPGTGSLALANASYFQGFNGPIPITDNTPGGGLDFTISPAVSGVPAPPGMALAGSGGALLLIASSLRGRRDVWLASLKRRADRWRLARILVSLSSIVSRPN